MRKVVFVEGYHLTPKIEKIGTTGTTVLVCIRWKISWKFYNLHGLSLGVVLGVVLLFFYKTKMCRRGGG